MDALSRGELAALDVVRAQGQTTRAVIAAEMGLSAAMTARLVTRLQDAGLVREAGRAAASGRGRQAELLELRPDAAYVLGIDIGTELVHLLVADLHGQPVAYREEQSAQLAGLTQPEIVTALAALVERALRSASVSRSRLAAAGVAITGIIDSERGVCLVRSNTPGWDNFAIAERLGAALGLHVVVDETARAKALAEVRAGAGRGADNFLFVDAGTAIGAAIVIGGRPLRGVSGLAGELGHITVDPSGPLCRCGNRGCVQASASARALVARAEALLERGVFSTLAGRSKPLCLTDLADAASRGDKLALGLLTEAGEQLGEAISMALNLLGFDLVVMSGLLAQCSPLVMEAASRTVQLRVLPIVPRPRTIARSALGRDAAARGVALQAIDWVFDDVAARLPRPARAHANGRLAAAMR